MSKGEDNFEERGKWREDDLEGASRKGEGEISGWQYVRERDERNDKRGLAKAVERTNGK